MPVTKLLRYDSNSDGKVDRYDLEIKFRTNPRRVRHVNVLASFEYFVQKKLKM